MVSKKKQPSKKRPPKLKKKLPKVRTESRPGRPKTEEIPGIQWLRHLTRMRYVTDQSGLSLRDMAGEPEFSGISRSTLERWSVEDHWVEKRQDFQASVAADIQAKVQDMIEEVRVRQLQDLDGVAQRLLAKLDETVTLPDGTTVPVVMPSSMEGVANALVRVVEASAKMREALAKEVQQVRPGGPGRANTMVTPTLADDEARESAKLIMRMRREKARHKLAQGKKQDKVEDKPKLRLVEGETNGAG